MTVLVLTCEEDLTADIVVSTLQDLGVPLVRLDPADLPGRVALSAEYAGDDFHGYLKAGTRMVSLSSLRSVWVRRPGTPGHAPRNSPPGSRRNPSRRCTACSPVPRRAG